MTQPAVDYVRLANAGFQAFQARFHFRDHPLVDGAAGDQLATTGIVQTAQQDGRADLSFTVGRPDLPATREAMDRLVSELGLRGVESDDQIAKVSIVGVGMRNHSGVAARMFEVLGKEGINIQSISTSEIKVSCVVHAKYTELAVRALHGAFGLDRAEAGRAG